MYYPLLQINMQSNHAISTQRGSSFLLLACCLFSFGHGCETPNLTKSRGLVLCCVMCLHALFNIILFSTHRSLNDYFLWVCVLSRLFISSLLSHNSITFATIFFIWKRFLPLHDVYNGFMYLCIYLYRTYVRIIRYSLCLNLCSALTEDVHSIKVRHMMLVFKRPRYARVIASSKNKKMAKEKKGEGDKGRNVYNRLIAKFLREFFPPHVI
jgi:hypothetical protein